MSTNKKSPKLKKKFVKLAKEWIDEVFFKKYFNFRTAGASDSSQMRDIMWTPPSPEKEEVEEETCVEINVQDKKAIPFFTHDSGCIYIQGIFSTPFTITYYFITPVF